MLPSSLFPFLGGRAVGLPEFARRGGGKLPIRHHYVQLPLEGVRYFGILRGFDFGDQPVEPRPQRRIRDFVLVAQSLQRTRCEHEPFEKPAIVLIESFQPGRQRLFHNLNMRFNFIQVNKIYVNFNKSEPVIGMLPLIESEDACHALPPSTVVRDRGPTHSSG